MTDVEPKLSLLPTSIPADLILRVAQGLEEPVDVAEEHGYDEATYRLLEQQDWFRSLVVSKKTELEQSGFVLKYKAGVYAENLMERVYQQARGEDIRLGDRLDALKYFSDIAGLKPKESLAAGPGFSITINMADGADVPETLFNPLEAKAAIIEAPMAVDIPILNADISVINEDLAAGYEEPPEADYEPDGFTVSMPDFNI